MLPLTRQPSQMSQAVAMTCFLQWRNQIYQRCLVLCSLLVCRHWCHEPGRSAGGSKPLSMSFKITSILTFP